MHSSPAAGHTQPEYGLDVQCTVLTAIAKLRLRSIRDVIGTNRAAHPQQQSIIQVDLPVLDSSMERSASFIPGAMIPRLLPLTVKLHCVITYYE